MSTDPTRIPIEFDPIQQRMRGTTRIGHRQFDVPFISKITANLWQGGCENGLILPTNINYLVSLYPWERYTVRHRVRGELYFRMHDDPDESMEQVDWLAHVVNHWRSKGTVLVHCQAGLNRSSLVAARALMLDGLSAEDAIALIRTSRSPVCLVNAGFETWLRSYDK